MSEGDLPTVAAQLRSGSLVLGAYLEALEAHFEAREPNVLAFVPEEGRFARLQHEAQVLLERYPEPAARPPLFGVPVGVKDIFHVDGFTTRAGSTVPPEVLQGEEAETVTRLKRAGALIMGKTVTTEFAYFAPGPTRNPHAPAHTPGGSSSGSAAAVAAGLCPLALGTQTIGSISRPAAFCGVVGFKPSYERISRQGVIPLSPGADHVGYFTTSAAGALLVAALLIAHWNGGQATPARHPVLGIPEGPYLGHVSPEGEAHLRSVRKQLLQAGLDLVAVKVMADFEEIYQRHNALVAAEAAAVHERWYGRYADHYHAKTVELIRRGQGMSAAASAAARAGRVALRTALAEAAERHGIDLWLAPAAVGTAPRGLESTGDPVMNLPWTHAGLPTVTLPAGQNEHGLPLGVQLVGSWYGDEQLLVWAQMLEDLLGASAPGSVTVRETAG